MQAEATPAQCSSDVVVVTTAPFVLLPCQSPGSPRLCLCAVLWEVFVHLLPGFFCPWVSLALCACFFPRLCHSQSTAEGQSQPRVAAWVSC